MCTADRGECEWISSDGIAVTNISYVFFIAVQFIGKLTCFEGNKGAAAVSFMFNGTSFCFICCHLTSGHEKLARSVFVSLMYHRMSF